MLAKLQSYVTSLACMFLYLNLIMNLHSLLIKELENQLTFKYMIASMKDSSLKNMLQ